MVNRIALCAYVMTLGACTFAELPPVQDDAGGSDGTLSDGAPDGADGPNVVITAGPSNTATTGPRVTFEFTVRDGEPYCRFDTGQLTPCVSPVVVNLGAGSHTFHVQAQNSSGAIESDSRVWTVACAPRQPTSDTFGLFRMDEGTGTTVANEHPATPPPANNHIRFADPPADPSWTTSGRFGSALRFSAAALNDTDRIYSDIRVNDLGTHGIEMWVNPMPTFPHDLELFYTDAGNQPMHMDYRLLFVRSGGQGRFRLTVRADTFNETIESRLVDLGSFHYVVVSYEQGTAPFLFVDGEVVRTSQVVTGTVDNFTFEALTKYEGDVDELHLTFHPFTEAELLNSWCPPP